MAGFKITTFRGIRPRISALKLPDGEAQTAANTRLGSGDIEPWVAPIVDQVVGNPFFNRTIYLFDNDGDPKWFEWDDFVSVAPGSVKGDVLERTYYTGEDFPKMTYRTIATTGSGPYPTAFRRLGIPAPSVAPTVSGSEAPEGVPSESRRTVPGSMITKLFEIVFVNWTVHPGSGSPDEQWNLGSAALGDIVFNMSIGDTLKVLEVLDSDTIRVGSATGTGAVAITAKNDKTSTDYWKPFDNNGSTQEADFTGWRLPDGVQVKVLGHLLRVGDVIRVTRLDYTNGLIFANTAAVNFFEQSWTAEADVTIGGSTFKQSANARVAASADATVDFANLEGGFYYDVDRSGSDQETLEDRSYVYTFVSALGEEGPPSPVSQTISAFDGDVISLAGLELPPTLFYEITQMRIYRTNATSVGTEFQFVKEFAVATSTTEAVKDVDLAEVITSTTYDAPPAGLSGITAMPNGMLVGFVGKTIHFSEPYFPHAWPAQYDQAIDFNCVALAPFGNSIAILTEGVPYILTASHPRNANIRPYKINQACVSAESIATDADRVIYASPDGLIELSVNGAAIVTEAYVKKDEWEAFVPESIVGEIHDGKYFGFFDGADNVPQAPASVFLSGTIVELGDTPTEDNIAVGTRTIILTLVSETWEVTAGSAFDAIRQNIIDGIVSPLGVFVTGWNAEALPNIPVTDVVRTSDTVVTITLSALATYSIIANETMSILVPAVAVAGSAALPADIGFTVIADNDYSSVAIAFSEFDNGGTEVPVSVAAQFDINDWDTYAGVGTDLNHEATFAGAAFALTLNRWLAVGFRSPAAPLIPDTPVFTTSEDNGITWTERFGATPLATNKNPRTALWYAAHNVFAVAGDNTSIQVSSDGIAWAAASADAVIPATESLRDLVIASGGDGSYMYAGCLTADFLVRSPNLEVFPASYTWAASTIVYVSATGTKHMASGGGKIVSIGNFNTDMEIATTLHAATSGTSVGAVSAYNCTGIVFGDDLWVAVSNDFRIVTCVSGSEGTIGNWSAPSTSKAANVTIEGIVFDEGDLVTQGYGYIAFGINTSSGFGVIYTSPDAVTWTLQKTLIEPVSLKAMAVAFPETQLGTALASFAPTFNGSQAPATVGTSNADYSTSTFGLGNSSANANTAITVQVTGSDAIINIIGGQSGGNDDQGSAQQASTNILNLNAVPDSIRIRTVGFSTGSTTPPTGSGVKNTISSFIDDQFFVPIEDTKYGYRAAGAAATTGSLGGIETSKGEAFLTVAITFRTAGFNDLTVTYKVSAIAQAQSIDIS